MDVIESRRAFVRFVSHEVRTPLSTAIMGLQLLLEEANEEQTTAAAAAVAAVDKTVVTVVDASVSSRRQEQKDMLRYGVHHIHQPLYSPTLLTSCSQLPLIQLHVTP